MSLKWIYVFCVLGLAVAMTGVFYTKQWASSFGNQEITKTLSSIEKYKKMQMEGAFDFDFNSLNLDENFDKELQIKSSSDEIKEITSKKNYDQKLSEFKGQIVLLNFWASWCEPCISEFPDMLSLKKQRPDVKVIAINQDQNLKDALKFIETFPEAKGQIVFHWDPEGKISKLYGTEVLPESYLIGKDFKVIRKIVGIEDWDHPNVLNFIDSL